MNKREAYLRVMRRRRWKMANAAPTIYSVRDGDWNDPGTWNLNRVPRFGDRVLLRHGHRIIMLEAKP